MQGKIILKALAAASFVALTATQAQAYDVVNTQVPTGSMFGSNALDSNDWLAEKFSVASTTQIDSVLAYVLSNDSANDLGKTFTIALYGNSASNLPALNWNANQQGQLFQATATYNGDGWNGLSNLNWTIGAGSYWLALEQNGDASNAGSLQLPTGALPAAQAVAFYSGGQNYAADTLSDTFGLHITAVTPAVPEPGSMALVLCSLGVMAFVARRRS